MCPVETPEGPNIGLIGSLASMATVSEFGFIQTPYRVVKNGKVTDEIVYLDAAEEAQFTIAQASEPVDETTGKFLHDQVLCRSREGEAVTAAPKEIEYMDVAPAQIVSVGTALIPFLEHNDANRALMGANMQRQAVPLMITQAPLVGTGLEYRAATDTGDVVIAEEGGTVVDVDAEKIVLDTKDGKHEYPMTKFMRSNQGTLIHQKPIVGLGERVRSEQVLADGSSTDMGELALGANLLVAFMPWEGYNFEDAIVISERLVKQDVRTRRARRPVAGRERARARLRGEEAQDRRGRQARRPTREQGRDREDRARGGHAVPRGRPPGRRGAEPARRPEPDEHRPDPRDASRLGGGARRLPRERRLGERRPEPDPGAG